MLGWSDVRYARSRDGALIAYQVRGEGTPILLLLDGFVAIEDMDDEPRLAGALRRLSTVGRAIRFDRRGIGLSDGGSVETPSLEDWLDDVEAILDAEGCAEAVVLGERGGALIGIALAALRSERVRALAVVNGFAKFLASPDHPAGTDPAFHDEVRERLFDPHHPAGPFDIIRHLAPSAADDTRFRQWWDRAGRRGASPATARALRHAIETLDVRHLLERVEAPTIVVQRTGSSAPKPEQGRVIAEGIGTSTFVPIAGDDAVWYVGDVDPIIQAVGRLTGALEADDRSNGELMTVLFTDIVNSTPQASALGNASWAQVFDAYERAAHRTVSEHHGIYVKSTGDGSLAVLDTPASGIACALNIRQGAAELGLEVRCAVHTDTIAIRGRDVLGIAVHVAARMLALAGPGEVLITEDALDAVPQSATVVDRGTTDLRGIDGDWHLFAVS